MFTDTLKQKYKGESILHGDFNISFYKNEKCKSALESKNWELSSGFRQLITRPMRVDRPRPL